MGKLIDLLTVYATYRDHDPLARLLQENFPGAFLIRRAVSLRLQGLKKLLGVR